MSKLSGGYTPFYAAVKSSFFYLFIFVFVFWKDMDFSAISHQFPVWERLQTLHNLDMKVVLVCPKQLQLLLIILG